MHNDCNKVGSAISDVYITAAVLLLTSFHVGCTDPAIHTFESTRLNDNWSSITGAELYSKSGSIFWYWYDGPKEGQGAVYYVFTSETGRVKAKLAKRACGYLYYELWITTGATSEFLRVEDAYPFPYENITSLPANDKASVPAVAGSVLRRCAYAPLRNPNSSDDPILPSGVRTSTWATLAMIVDGWPANSSQEMLSSFLNSRKLTWNNILMLIPTQPVDDEIRIRGYPGMSRGD